MKAFLRYLNCRDEDEVEIEVTPYMTFKCPEWVALRYDKKSITITYSDKITMEAAIE